MRDARRPMTGRPVRAVEVVVGVREDGSRSVTVHAQARESWPFTDPALLEGLARELVEAAEYLRGGWRS